jgi:hypothetical protein
MTTYFEYNAKAREAYTPRKEDVIEWPAVFVAERPMTPEDRKRFERKPEDMIEWP